MKYCFNYNRRSKKMKDLDEVNIKLDPEDTKVMMDYIKEHKHQRINVRINDIKDILSYNLLDDFEDFHKDNPEVNFSIILPKYDLNLAQLCQQKGLKFFFDVVVRDWETLNQFLEAGVCDVYLVEQMMFEIKDAAAAVHKYGASVRTFPNIAQRRYEETPALKTFFIRPEDIELYEGLVDVMDLYTIEEINEDIVLEVYQDDHMWWGPLKEIIIGLDNDIDGKYIIPRFGQRRLDCERKCFKGNSCNVCFDCEDLSKNLEKAGLLIQYEKMLKKEKEKEEEENKNG